jgi:tetratricopeptide (TPR) repeat protein
MKRLLVLLVIAIGSMPALARADRDGQVGGSRLSKSWNRVIAGDLVALGDASERTLRKRVEQIASFRAALAQLYPDMRVDSPVPYRVVLFPTAAALRRYVPRDEQGRPRPYVSGYFGGDADLNVIALGGGDANAVFHEFAHSFLSRNFHSLPEWLEEGLAEFHSTFDADPRKKHGLIGLAPATRLRSLRTLPYLPITDFILATPGDLDKLWRDGARTEMLYAEAWALVHYLQIGRRSSLPGAFGRFVVALDRGTPAEQAFRVTFGAGIEQIDEELRQYVKRPAFASRSVDLATQGPGAVLAEPMTQADVSFVRGDLLARVGEFEEAEQELTNALALEAGHVDARVALAGVHLGEGRTPEALQALEQIVRTGPASFLATHRLATALAASDRHLDALEMYSRATTLLDASPNPWYGVSLSSLALGRESQADAAMSHVQQRQPDPAWYLRRARDALGLGLDAPAAADARRFLAQVGWDADSVFAAFIAALALQRLNRPQEAAEILEAARNTPHVTAWARALIDYLDDRLPSAALLARAANARQKTEAHAYVGLRSAIGGRLEEALLHLRWVRERGVRNSVTFGMARSELKRLEGRDSRQTLMVGSGSRPR